MKRKFDHGDDAAERLGLEVLGWLAQDPERLHLFMAESGLTPDALRAAAGEPGFLGAVLDHVMRDEPMLLACARDLALKPERVAAAWARLQPPPFDEGGI